MKFRIMALGAVFICITFTLFTHWAAAKSPGQIRALKDRANKVTQMKNEFVTRVLDDNQIAYQLTDDGVVAKLKLDGAWEDVNRIEIIPVPDETEKLGIKGHDLFFYTKDQIFHLFSSIIVH